MIAEALAQSSDAKQQHGQVSQTAAKFAQLHQPQIVSLRAAFMELVDLFVIPHDVNNDCQFLKT